VEKPLLIYQNSTFASVDTLRSLIKAGHFLPRNKNAENMNCFVLMDDYRGINRFHQILRDYKDMMDTTHDMENKRIDYACSSQIYDKLFANVRYLLREGFEPEEIQEWLDLQ